MKDFDEREHHLLTTTTGNFTFQKVTQSLLYAQLNRLQYLDHLIREVGGETPKPRRLG